MPTSHNLDILDKKLIEFAKDDLKTADIFLEHKNYTTVLYHLEQSYEKIIKSYYVFIKKHEGENIKEIYENLKRLMI